MKTYVGKRIVSVLFLVLGLLLPSLGNAATPNDPFFPRQWGFNNTGQIMNTDQIMAADWYSIPDSDIDAPEAWDISTDAGDIVVAIIDSGVAYDHTDLAENMWDGSKNCRDENNNVIEGGCPHHGLDFTDKDNDPYDATGRGTNVAGIIGAVGNNGIGVAGVAWKVQIMALKVSDNSGVVKAADMIRAIYFAKNNGADIITIGYARTDFSQEEYDALASFDGLVVAPSSEGSVWSVSVDEEGPLVYPATYNLSNILAVVGSTADEYIASSWGHISIDVAAPGVWAYTTSKSGAYELVNDISPQATGMVSGQAALLMARNPLLTTAQIKTIIMQTVDLNASMPGEIVSGGRVNLYNALSAFKPEVQFFLNSVAQAQDGSGTVTIKVTAKNSIDGLPIQFQNFEYSVDGGVTFAAPERGDGSEALGGNWNAQNGLTAGDQFGEFAFSFTLNTKHADLTGLNNIDQSDIMVRLKGFDGAARSDFSLSPNFRVDNAAPVAMISNTPEATTLSTSISTPVAGDGVTHFRFSIDGDSYSEEKTAGTIIALSSLSIGTHTLRVIGKDSFGNYQSTATPTVFQWTVTEPNNGSTTIAPPSNGSGGGGSSGSFVFPLTPAVLGAQTQRFSDNDILRMKGTRRHYLYNKGFRKPVNSKAALRKNKSKKITILTKKELTAIPLQRLSILTKKLSYQK